MNSVTATRNARVRVPARHGPTADRGSEMLAEVARAAKTGATGPFTAEIAAALCVESFVR